jgi:hypothetical protein
MKGRNPYRSGTPASDAWDATHRAPKPAVIPAIVTSAVLEVTTTPDNAQGDHWPVMGDPTAQDDLKTARAVLEGPLSRRATPASDAEIVDRLRSWRIFGRALHHCPHGNSTGAATHWRSAYGLDRWGVHTCSAVLWLVANWAEVKRYRWNSANPTEIRQACQRNAYPDLMTPETDEPNSMSKAPMTRTERMAEIRAELVTLEAEQEQALMAADVVVVAAQQALDKAMAERAALAI